MPTYETEITNGSGAFFTLQPYSISPVFWAQAGPTEKKHIIQNCTQLMFNANFALIYLALLYALFQLAAQLNSNIFPPIHVTLRI